MTINTQDNKDIQPQAEPHIVKSHDIHIDADYAVWIANIKSRYHSSQVKAAVKVNAEKLLFNWQLGRDLVQKKAEERWGTGIIERNYSGQGCEGFVHRGEKRTARCSRACE